MSAKTMASSGHWTIPSDPGQRLQRGGVEEARSAPRVKPEAAVIAKANVDGSIAMVFQQYPAVPKRPKSERCAPPKDHERENVERIRKIQAENRAKQQEQQQQATKADVRRGPMKAVHRSEGAQDMVDGSLVVTGSQKQQKHRHHRPRTQPAAEAERPPSCHACGQYLRERGRRSSDVPVLDIPSASDTGQSRHHEARRRSKPRQEPRRQDEVVKTREATRARSGSLDRRPATVAAAAPRSADVYASGGHDRGRARRPASAAAAKRDASYDEPPAPRRRGSLGGRGSSSSGRDFVAENVKRLADQPRALQRSSSLSLGQLSVTGSRKQAVSASSESHRKGELPAYLVKRREQWRQDEAERFARQPDPNCPPGHVVMKPDERLTTLQQLESRHDKMSKELQCMPVRTDTLRMKNRKTELEQSLREVEDALKIFSRPTVYVKQDQ